MPIYESPYMAAKALRDERMAKRRQPFDELTSALQAVPGQYQANQERTQDRDMAKKKFDLESARAVLQNRGLELENSRTQQMTPLQLARARLENDETSQSMRLRDSNEKRAGESHIVDLDRARQILAQQNAQEQRTADQFEFEKSRRANIVATDEAKLADIQQGTASKKAETAQGWERIRQEKLEVQARIAELLARRQAITDGLGGRPPEVGQIKEINDIDQTVKQLDTALSLKGDIDTGPIAGPVLKGQAKVGLSTPEKVKFLAALGDLQAAYMNMISGQTVGEAERERLERNLPTVNDNDEELVAKAQRMKDELRAKRTIKLNNMEAAGVGVRKLRETNQVSETRKTKQQIIAEMQGADPADILAALRKEGY